MLLLQYSYAKKNQPTVQFEVSRKPRPCVGYYKLNRTTFRYERFDCGKSTYFGNTCKQCAIDGFKLQIKESNNKSQPYKLVAAGSFVDGEVIAHFGGHFIPKSTYDDLYGKGPAPYVYKIENKFLDALYYRGLGSLADHRVRDVNAAFRIITIGKKRAELVIYATKPISQGQRISVKGSISKSLQLAESANLVSKFTNKNTEMKKVDPVTPEFFKALKRGPKPHDYPQIKKYASLSRTWKKYFQAIKFTSNKPTDPIPVTTRRKKKKSKKDKSSSDPWKNLLGTPTKKTKKKQSTKKKTKFKRLSTGEIKQSEYVYVTQDGKTLRAFVLQTGPNWIHVHYPTHTSDFDETIQLDDPSIFVTRKAPANWNVSMQQPFISKVSKPSKTLTEYDRRIKKGLQAQSKAAKAWYRITHKLDRLAKKRQKLIEQSAKKA